MNTIVIPAYEPDAHLIELIQNLKQLTDETIIVVNDGSSQACADVFQQVEALSCILLTHEVNQGKGAALKTAFTYAKDVLHIQNGLVTCDADGQHRPDDILKVSKTLEINPNALVLGERIFSSKQVPLRSKLGNKFSSFYMKQKTNTVIEDTQTGLRGIPYTYLDQALSIEANRYDYEMDFLIKAIQTGVPIVKVPIQTAYIENNQSSHFRPIVDSLKIYKQPLRFLTSSLTSALIDLSIFSVLVYFLDQSILWLVVISTLIARLISGIYNFILNRIWSFKSFSNIHKQGLRYFLLYLTQLTLSMTFVYLLSFLFTQLTVVKAFVDFSLFITSYFIQKNWVFKKV